MQRSRVWPGLLFLALLMAIVMALPALAQAQGEGVIEGTVENGTPSGPAVGAGLPVTLRLFLGDLEMEAIETTTADDGSFRFEGLDMDPAMQYWPEVVYLGAVYGGDEPLQFAEGQSELVTTLMVYETTTDDSDIRLNSVHMIAESFGQVLRVSEIHLFGNDGDRAYVGAPGEDGRLATVTIPLPDGAVGLSFGGDVDPERLLEVEGGLLDTEPVVPGPESSLVFFSYHVVVAGETVAMERRFAYPVDDLNILVAQPGLALTGGGLTSQGVELFQGRQYQFYTAQALGADTALDLEFAVLPEEVVPSGEAPESSGAMAGTVAEGNQGVLRSIGYALAALAVVGAVGYSLGTRQRSPAQGGATDPTTRREVRRLLADLADLEDAYEAGQIDERQYRRRRAEIYGSLKSG
jgi:hypothetical protein